MTKKAAAAHTCWFLLVMGACFSGKSTPIWTPAVETAGTPPLDIAVAVPTMDMRGVQGNPVKAAETSLQPLAVMTS